MTTSYKLEAIKTLKATDKKKTVSKKTTKKAPAKRGRPKKKS